MKTFSRSTIHPDDVIDMHVHVGGPAGENDEMYFWSKEFTKSAAYDAMKLVTKLSSDRVNGPRYIGVLLQLLKQSKYIDKLVMLGLDQVYTEKGKKEPDRTNLYVSNDYLYHLSQIYPSFLFGCSVHPYAPDAIDRVWQCAARGAVLCKWLPSSQCFDPTHPLARRFYEALALVNLPLLLHVGPEGTIPSALDHKSRLLYDAAAGEYGQKPGDAVAMALEAGVKVIIAHSATPLGPLFDKDTKYWEKVFDQLLERMDEAIENPLLYADISAFCLPGRFKYVKRIIKYAEKKPHRFLYGSDYPIPSIGFHQGDVLKDLLDAFDWLANRVLPGNDLDKNYELLRPHFSDKTFRAAARVLRNPQMPVIDKERFIKIAGKKKKRFFIF
ncbi:amidohydrolase family protein [candidate division KSB1 bacterium]|nr:amidohydrolase family protein [candidate division KSB1 bacterium]